MFANRQFIIVFCISCISYPLSLYRDIHKLSIASTFALCGMLTVGVSVLSGAAVAASIAVLFPMTAALTLLPALIAASEGVLRSFQLRWYDKAALTVVMAAKGYPDAYRKGTEIRGLEKAAALPDVTVFHAGTKGEDGRILANGGRVLNVTATGRTIAEAQQRAYEAVDLIDWPEGFCRRDIGWRAIGS